MKIYILALIIGQLTEGQSSTISPADADLLRAVADAADENRAKFIHGTVLFRRQDGYADSLDEAKAGNLRYPYEAAGTYTFDGTHAFYEQRFPLDAMAATTAWSSASSSASRLDSFRSATNGKFTLFESISANQAGDREVYGRVITAGTQEFTMKARFPLRLGFPDVNRGDFAAMIRLVMNGSVKSSIVTIDSDAILDGLKVIKIVVKTPEARVTFWVDLERGAIPILYVHESGKVKARFEHLGRIEHVLNHGWLPLEMTIHSTNSGVSTKRIVIDKYDFDEKPKPGSFVMTFPEPVAIGNEANGMGYNRPQKVWDLDNLPSDTAPGVHPLRKAVKPSLAASLPGERQPRPRYGTIGAVAIAAVVAAVGLWRWRKSRAG